MRRTSHRNSPPVSPSHLPFALAVILVSFLGCSPTTEAIPAANPHSNETELLDLDGHKLLVSNDPQTVATALVFILPDCPICNAYVPELNRLHAAFASRGANLVLMHVDPDVTAERARSHASEYQLAMPIALDPLHHWVAKAGATMAPEAAVFSPRGELLYRGRIDDQYAGLGKRRAKVTSHDLAAALEAILASQPVPQPRTEAVGCLIPKLPSGK